jgi:hypothetical protein
MNAQLLQDAANHNALLVLDSIGRAPEYRQRSIANFAVNVLKIDAESGYASAQHNYAVMHNVDPECKRDERYNLM